MALYGDNFQSVHIHTCNNVQLLQTILYNYIKKTLWLIYSAEWGQIFIYFYHSNKAMWNV